MSDFKRDLELVDELRNKAISDAIYILELERELRFVRQQLDAQVKTFHTHAVAQAARISDLERHLQRYIDGRPA
jgi:hypothetical protein